MSEGVMCEKTETSFEYKVTHYARNWLHGKYQIFPILLLPDELTFNEHNDFDKKYQYCYP